MGIRDRLAGRAAPFLEPDEQLRYVFMGQEGPSPWLVGITWLSVFFYRYRIICVTDRAIVVLGCPKLRSKPSHVLMRLPRHTFIGPLSGSIYGKTMLTGKTMYVHRIYHKDVAAADAEVATGGPLPTPQMPAPPGMPPVPQPQPQPQTVPAGPAPGWYPDPQVPNQQRWHDGARWTEHVHTG
jgi:Protein of unknown function (DUF2510)